MKKTFAIILATLMLLSTFTGCASKPAAPEQSATPSASSSAPAAEPAEKVEIQFLHGQPEEPRVKAIQSIIDKFTAANPNVTLTQMPVPEDGFWTKITTLMSSGELPAIVEGGVDQLRLMNAEEALDLSANTAAIEAIGKDRYFAGALEMAKAPGSGDYLGVPVSGWVSGVWYRKSMFAEKGLAAPDTWENILAAAKALNDPANKKYGILFATEESDFTEQTFSHFALSNQALLFDANGNPQFTTPEMKEAVQFYKDLYAYTMPGSNGVEQVKDAFVGGHCAMAMYSTYIMGALQEQGIANDIGFAIPKNKVEAGFGMTSTMTISNMIDEKQRDAAIKFVSSMGDITNNITWCHMSAGGSNPVLKDVASDPKYLENDVLKAFGETAAKVPESFEQLQMLGFQNGEPHPAMGTITGKFIIPKCLNQVLVQGKDIDAAMAETQKSLEAEVAAVKK
jgi:multiple sugar transport system substrate-binding protein